MSTITIPQLSKSGTISVKPYVDTTVSNQGLEKYNMVIFDGTSQEEQVAFLDHNGVKRYITGLNEFAPEIKLIQEPEVREAKIKEIRTIVQQLEKELAANVILDIEDPKFWDKVIMLGPNNHDFWGKLTMRCGNTEIRLDPAKDPMDLIKICAIEAGGFSLIAPSFDAAKSMSKPPKFYLDKYIDTVSTKTEVKKLKNKAISELTGLFNKNVNKLFYIAKVVDSNSAQYKKTTPNDIIYDNMDNFINGMGIEKNMKRASQAFLDACTLDMETLKLRAMIKDATFFKIIALKSDGFIYHVDSSVMLGRTSSECLEFLKNPLHDKTLIDITNKIDKFWNL